MRLPPYDLAMFEQLFGGVVAAALGLSLAASCGLRAFLPLLVLGVAGRVGGDSLNLIQGEAFEWIKSTPALIALSVAVVVEVLADKVPALDHLLDVIQAPVRTGAGMLAAAAVAGHLPMWATATLALIAGGGALSVHAGKSALRVGSTATTAGTANPLISIAEDIACLGLSVLSILLGAAVVCLALFVLVALIFVFVKWRARRAARKELAEENQAPPETG